MIRVVKVILNLSSHMVNNILIYVFKWEYLILWILLFIISSKVLRPEIQTAYYNRLGAAREIRNDDNYSYGSLQKVVSICIKLQVESNTASISSSGYNNSYGGNKSGDSKGKHKYCKNHPNATSHTTAECKLKDNTSRSQSSSSNSGSQKQFYGNCHNCGNPGHQIKDCPNKSSSGSSSSYNNTPSNNSSNSSSSAIRSGSPPRYPHRNNVKAPERYILRNIAHPHLVVMLINQYHK